MWPSSDQNLNEHGHVAALDGIRGVAILMILTYHTGILTPFSASPHSILNSLVRNCGWAGVDLFFVLSGFLITTILLKSRRGIIGLRNFYVRRILRIFPLYYLFIATLFFVMPHVTKITDAVGYLFLYDHQKWFWLYGQNILFASFGRAPRFSYVNHLWSLAIEEQFYCLWPLLVFSCSVKTLKRLCWIVIPGVFLIRIILSIYPIAPYTIYAHTITRCDTLLYGCLLALLFTNSQVLLPWKKKLIPLFCALAIGTIVLLCTVPEVIVQTLGYSLIALVSTLFIATCLLNDTFWGTRLMCSRFFRFFGKYSYGLYLLHWPLFTTVGLKLASLLSAVPYDLVKALTVFLTCTTISCLCALTAWYLIERNFLALKRFFPVNR